MYGYNMDRRATYEEGWGTPFKKKDTVFVKERDGIAVSWLLYCDFTGPPPLHPPPTIIL